MNNRKELLLKIIREKDVVSIQELQRLFPEKSSMTIRRDLTALQEEGKIIRIHGGARINPAFASDNPEEVHPRDVKNPAKETVAKKALELVSGHRCLYLDAGTTVYTFAKILETSPDMTCITPGIDIAYLLLKKQNPPRLTLLGGSVTSQRMASSGTQTLRQLEGINIDTAIMCTSGFTPETGFTGGEADECELKKAVMAKAHRVIMLMTGVKEDLSMLYTFATARDIDYLVCDTALEPESRKYLEEANVRIL